MLRLSSHLSPQADNSMAQNRNKGGVQFLDPTFMLGVVGTVCFYVVVHQPSMRESVLHRYTAGNIVEYVIVWLFIWASFDVILKLLWFPREMIALRLEWIPHRQGREPAANASTLLETVCQKPRWLLNSRLGKRLQQSLEFVAEKSAADEYREHLKYLSEQDEDLTHSNYNLIRFAAGVAPVLGFLGTVIHFGTALSGISFDEMAERLPVIVSEMGTAFNTTTVALATAMTMMFALFGCERVERGIVRSIDRIIDRELLSRFESTDPSIGPFLSAVQHASEEALQTIGANLDRQIAVWVQTLDSLFRRFDERQQHEAKNWQAALQLLQQRHEGYDGQREERQRQLVGLVESKQTEHLARIEAILDRTVGFKDEFVGFLKTFDSIARGEGKLVELQSALSHNLHVLRETQQLDEAMHGLTAAIHLLTARHRTGKLTDAA